MKFSKFNDFAVAMHKKAESKANEKNRTDTPWKDFSWKHLNDRLTDEIIEHDGAVSDYYHEETDEAKQRLMDECIDVANFCMFLYYNLKEIEE